MANNIGIMDPDGVNNNPLTGQIYSDMYRKLSFIWQEFPTYKNRSEIIETLKNNQVTLVVSGTGSGKTVLLPKFLLHIFDYKKKIAICLPKQIITKSAAEFAATTLDVKLGEEVGYKYKGSAKSANSAKSLLLYATDGTIINRLLKDPSLEEFNGIVIDEAHERGINIDFMMYLLKQTLKLRPEFKLIIMSATINEEIFKSYFIDFKFKIVNIGTEAHYPIDSKFLKEPLKKNEYLGKSFEILKKILAEDDVKTPNGHDIIIFVPSVADAFELCKRTSAEKLDVICIEIFSGVNEESKELAIDKEKYKQFGKSRKLIVGTNVIESSMTFSNIKYVIDSGLEFKSSYSPENDARVLDKQFITKGQVRQRKGRTGRQFPGVVYHLYTQKEYDDMQDFPEPSIRTSNIYQECLSLLNYPNIKTVPKLIDVLSDFIEPPKEIYIRSALSQLKELGLVEHGEMSPLGKIISSMQMDPMMALSIYASRCMKCSNEVLTILSIIEVAKFNISEIFQRPKNLDDKKKAEKYKKARKNLHHKSGDHMTLYNIMNKYEELKKKEDSSLTDYLHTNFIKNKIVEKSYRVYKHYKKQQRNFKTPSPDDFDSERISTKVLTALFYGYRTHKARLRDRMYYTEKAGKVKLARESFLNIGQMPKQVFYHELFISSGRADINIVSDLTKTIIDSVDKLDYLIKTEMRKLQNEQKLGTEETDDDIEETNEVQEEKIEETDETDTGKDEEIGTE